MVMSLNSDNEFTGNVQTAHHTPQLDARDISGRTMTPTWGQLRTVLAVTAPTTALEKYSE